MMKPTFLIFSLVIGYVSAESGLHYPSVWQCDTDKFNWYCDLDDEKSQSSQSIPTEVPPRSTHNAARRPQRLNPLSVAMKDIKTAEQLRKELKRREDLAVMDPTDENMRGYLALWQIVQNKGAVFADQWRRIVWQNPDLDYAQKRPVNNAAIKIYDENRIQNEEQQLKRLAKKHGLIFFFRSDCRYCHAMAPTLKMLSEKQGIEVLGVSMDGSSLPEFPTPRDGRTQAAVWGIERVPALFIGSKQTGEHAPIGFGMMALSEIIHRIFVLTGTQVGDTF